MIPLPELEQKARDLAGAIDDILNGEERPKKIAFCLMLADFGEGGHTTYISNGQREDMIKLLNEALMQVQPTSDNWRRR